ncbi:MAG: four helix bundle protein, partial [Nitrospirae bacterium]|nr:four helix bundle protein [Nitrospirota bacterium]
RTQAGRILADQLLRSVGSISANIAEGFGRRQGKEYLHYLVVARGSTTESLNWYIKVRDIGLIDGIVYDGREGIIIELLKMLNKMIGQGISATR